MRDRLPEFGDAHVAAVTFISRETASRSSRRLRAFRDGGSATTFAFGFC